MLKRFGIPTLATLGVVLLLGGSVLCQQLPVLTHPDTAGWKPLFNPDLSNALMAPGDWVAENGVLHALGHGTIWTKASYGDFALDMEFKVGKGANSGVFLRTGDIKDILSAIEVQIHETTDGTKYGMVGAVYDLKPPSRDMAKPPGEWNRYTITCKGSRIYLVFNGIQVIDMNLDDWAEARKNPDGTANKFPKPLKEYSRKGPIGLQGIHGSAGQPVWFRNVKVKEL
jgi:hypothetical protein